MHVHIHKRKYKVSNRPQISAHFFYVLRYMHANIHTKKHTFSHTYISTRTRTHTEFSFSYICIFIQTYVQTYIFHIPAYPHTHTHTHRVLIFIQMHYHTQTYIHTASTGRGFCAYLCRFPRKEASPRHKWMSLTHGTYFDSDFLCVNVSKKMPVLGINECYLRTVRMLTQRLSMSISPKGG